MDVGFFYHQHDAKLSVQHEDMAINLISLFLLLLHNKIFMKILAYLQFVDVLIIFR